MLIVQNALHTMTSDGNVVLEQFTYIPTDDDRTYSIGDED